MVINLKEGVLDFLYKMNRCIMMRGKCKKGEMEIDELIKLAVIIIVIVVMVIGIFFLWPKAGRIFGAIRDTFRFGG